MDERDLTTCPWCKEPVKPWDNAFVSKGQKLTLKSGIQIVHRCGAEA